MKALFYDDNDEFFDTKLLRELAHAKIVNSPLIRHFWERKPYPLAFGRS
jgi:hypothetical protein